MENIKKCKKKKYFGLTIDGYRWFSFQKGLHSFMKELPNRKWAVIKCREEQIHNGDLEFMVKHDLTLI